MYLIHAVVLTDSLPYLYVLGECWDDAGPAHMSFDVWVPWAREQFAAVKFQAIVFNARNPNFANGLRLISTGTHPRTSPGHFSGLG